MTPKIPIILRLKTETQRKVAIAQDIIIEKIFKIFDKAILHGGTAIWRCYNGNRFSEDVDVYIPRDIKKIEEIFKILESEGFSIEKKKISENSLYSNLKFDRILVRFEALFKIVKGELKDYETTDGNFTTISCLKLDDLIKEKINAYSKRLKIRDLYDIFYLLRYLDNKKKIKLDLEIFIKNFKKPLDEKDLKILIIDGLSPNAEQMLDYIGRK